MRQFFPSRSSSVIGLDIRLNGIRFMHLRRIKQTYQVEAAEVIELPADAIIDGRIKAPDPVIQRIRAIVQQTETQHYPACIALPAQSVMTKRIPLLKKVTSAQRAGEIEENISRYFPGFSHELCYDYAVLSDADNLHDTVLWVATRQEQLNDYINVVERAGLSVKMVDVDMYALARAAQCVTKEVSTVALMVLLEVEASSVLLVVLHHNEVTYHLQWDYTEAEEIYVKLISAIQWYCSTHHLAQLSHVYLSGDSERLSIIMAGIQERLSINVQRLTFSEKKTCFNPRIPFESIQNKLQKMMVCYGLALRRMPAW